MTSDVKDGIVGLCIDLRQFLGAGKLFFDDWVSQEIDVGAVTGCIFLLRGINVSDEVR